MTELDIAAEIVTRVSGDILYRALVLRADDVDPGEMIIGKYRAEGDDPLAVLELLRQPWMVNEAIRPPKAIENGLVFLVGQYDRLRCDADTLLLVSRS